MKIDLPYVQPVKVRGRMYYYFRKGKVRFKLSAEPGSRDFDDAYETALRTHAPEEFEARRRQASRGGRGSVAWVIEQFRTKSPQWLEATTSTQKVYDRRHHWLTKNYGGEQIADFDREKVRHALGLCRGVFASRQHEDAQGDQPGAQHQEAEGGGGRVRAVVAA
jgi:hypothetical protein